MFAQQVEHAAEVALQRCHLPGPDAPRGIHRRHVMQRLGSDHGGLPYVHQGVLQREDTFEHRLTLARLQALQLRDDPALRITHRPQQALHGLVVHGDAEPAHVTRLLLVAQVGVKVHPRERATERQVHVVQHPLQPAHGRVERQRAQPRLHRRLTGCLRTQQAGGRCMALHTAAHMPHRLLQYSRLVVNVLHRLLQQLVALLLPRAPRHPKLRLLPCLEGLDRVLRLPLVVLWYHRMRRVPVSLTHLTNIRVVAALGHRCHAMLHHAVELLLDELVIIGLHARVACFGLHLPLTRWCLV
eukprot:764581-Hanusia_phi.AAC.3